MRMTTAWVIFAAATLLGTACSKDETKAGAGRDPAQAASAVASGPSASASPTASAGTELAPAAAGDGGAVAGADAGLPTQDGSAALAHRHLPEGCDVVGRLDLGRVLAHPAVAKELGPAIGELTAQAAPVGSELAQLQAFLKDAQLDLRMSFRSAAFCFKDAKPEPEVVVALGGTLAPETIVGSLRKSATKMKGQIEKLDGRQVLREGDFMLGQAADGALVFASDMALFRAASEPSDRHASLYALPTSGDGAWVATERFVKAMATKGSGLPKELGQLGRLSGSLDLAAGKVEARVDCPTESDAVKLAGALVFAKAGFEDELAKQAPPPVRAAVQRLTARADGKAVLIAAALPEELLELGCKLAAEQLRAAVRKP